MSDKDMKNMDHSKMDHEKMDCCSTDKNGHMNHKNMKNCDMDHMQHDDKKNMHHDMSNMEHDHSEHMKHGMDHNHEDHSHMHHDMDHMGMGSMNHDHGHMMMNHGGHMMDMGDLKKKFWISLILTIPIILMSPMMGMKLPFQLTFSGSDFIVLILGSILFFYCSTPFFNGAKGEIQNKKPEMMSLITLGISVAYIYSIYAVVANDILHVTPMVNDFFWELSTLIVIMLLGHWIEMNSVMNAGSAINKLSKLLPDNAHLISDNQTKDVFTSELSVGDNILIQAGEKIPADGTIYDGSTSVNESLVTGESRNVNKKSDDSVIGGSVNGNGTIKVKISGTGNSGYLSKVMNMVQEAQSAKSKTENLANQVASYLFYAALIVAVIAFVAWSLIKGVSFAIPVTVTVLIIACPHALGLAVPLIISRTTSIAATNGLLIRNKTALEKINDIKYALMDKTGTLTEGKFQVNGYDSLDNNYAKDEILKIAASVEQNSNHPLATGIMEAAKQKELSLSDVNSDNQITGYGMKGTINDHEFLIVSAAYLDTNNIQYDASSSKQYLEKGNSLSYVVENNKVIGFVAEGDSIKAGSKDMIQYLQSQGITPVMLTGDNESAANKVASLLGITEVKAKLLPEDKQKNVTDYQKNGKVMFIGDGINDAPSLTQSDMGIAIGSGTDVAVDSADVVLVNSNPLDVVSLVKLAKESHTKMIQNLWWGAGYNIVALPLAAGILAFAGIMLDPMVGAIIMSLSTVIVALNALTLKIK
ncbi:heavy metal translocating P-type ATPase [Apilactobacillus timberlakei]|uniref:heavy metal translocating P-type ATPase n=1 Tax=Apilactobacillus timberlakei TaxID=2008380 RepID=UPI00112652E0|nr:heavy metal translocating P-type ATPase [Apilactobacillus timberlakei]TPR22674.1 copper-translocating P-type ATPase [Apilactobacillus timberlakei]